MSVENKFPVVLSHSTRVWLPVSPRTPTATSTPISRSPHRVIVEVLEAARDAALAAYDAAPDEIGQSRSK